MNIIRHAQQEVSELTQKQRDTLKKRLTFKNPAYQNAKRYGRSKYISIPKTLEYFSEHSVSTGGGERKKVLTVPGCFNVLSALNVSLNSVGGSDHRVSRPVEFPEFALTLRADQKEAEDSYLWQVHHTVYPKCLIQLPTGKGKTILALHLAGVLKQKTLILVHKEDLVTGWQKDIKLCYPTMKPGLIKAKSRRVGEQVTIATVQTLSRMNEDELSTYLDQFGFVVQDECHHIGLNIFNVIGKFNSKYKLGLTATPKRGDGLDFVFDLFLGGICYFYQPPKNEEGEDEEDEDISSVEVRVVNSPYRYKPFVFDGQVFNLYDFSPADLPEKFELLEEIPYDRRPTLPYLVVDNAAVSSEDTMKVVVDLILKEYGQGHSVLALFTQKEHIRQYRDALCEVVPEEQVILYYGDSKESSSDMMERAESKKARITLATYAKATEGTNVKAWEVEFLVSSLNNEKNVEQATGRIRRRKEGNLDPVRVYDINFGQCYSLRNHIDTRLRVYHNLGYTVITSGEHKKKSIFSRGYR